MGAEMTNQTDGDDMEENMHLYLHAIRSKPVPAGVLTALERNASRTKDATRQVPRPAVISVKVNQRPGDTSSP
jgi:hypothetical protein